MDSCHEEVFWDLIYMVVNIGIERKVHDSLLFTIKFYTRVPDRYLPCLDTLSSLVNND